jgi:DHA1 family multidrug resistance protein-like MFS transporter
MGGWIADTYGYQMTFYLTAALLFIAGLAVTFFVHEKFDRDKEMSREKVTFLQEWKSIFSAPGVTATFGLRFLTQAGRMMVFAILAFFARELIVNEAQLNSTVGLMMGISAAAATLSAVFLGKLGDRVGHRKVLFFSTLASGLFYLPQAAVTEVWQLIVLQGLVGVALGGIIPSLAALLANYTQPGHEGAAFGLDNSVNAGGRSVAPLAGGAIASWLGLRATFTSTAILFFLTAAVAFFFLPNPRKANQPVASTD